MSIGLLPLAPLLPEFLAQYPEMSIHLHLSDAMVDMIGDGCGIPRYVGSPRYLKTGGRPRHPLHLAQHVCITYGHAAAPESWRFTQKTGNLPRFVPQDRLV